MMKLLLRADVPAEKLEEFIAYVQAFGCEFKVAMENENARIPSRSILHPYASNHSADD